MSMAGPDIGSTLFNRENEDCDSDAWDDTALIEAYDAAVAPLKAKLAERMGDTLLLHTEPRPADEMRPKKKKNKKKKSKKKHQVMGWQVGDHCQAVYTEDGEIYEAKILSIDSDNQTCVVRYLGYGNEEQQSLEDLMPSSHHSNKPFSYSETDSVDTSHSHRSNKASSKRAFSHSVNAPTSAWNWPGFASFGFGKAPPPMFSGIPGHGTFPFPQHGGGAAGSMPFPAMPPPPPPMPMGCTEDENEALCSMLLAWYMSGYHTGYYQGLKQCRHDINGASAL